MARVVAAAHHAAVFFSLPVVETSRHALRIRQLRVANESPMHRCDEVSRGAASLSDAMCATASLELLSGTDATVTLGGQRGSGVGAKPEAAAKHSEIPTSIVAA